MYEDIKGNVRFDFSNYSTEHANYDASRAFIPGLFKDEMGGKLIDEFCGLRSKMYSILNYDGGNKKTGNGIAAQVKNDQITHEDYRNSLLNQEVRYHLATKIMQKNHNLHTVDFAKKNIESVQ